MTGAGSGRLGGKVALITGAASGIGLATTEMFISQGAAVILGDINAEAGEAAAACLRDGGGVADFVSLDVTSEESWIAAMDAARRLHGRLDILVNNAGVGTAGSIEEATLEEWRHTHAVNAEGPFLGCKHGIALMKESGDGGSIVNVSSVASIRPVVFNSVDYDAAKAGVNAMTRAFAAEFAGDGIRVNAIMPGGTNSGGAGRMGGEQVRIYGPITQPGRVLMNRIAEPIEQARAILFLASPASSYITGQTLAVEGGALLS